MTEDYFGVLAVIRYHVSWPAANDPYYLFNSAENMARNNYYNNNYTPHFFVDGNLDGGYNSGGWETMIDDESFNYSPLIITLTGVYHPDTRDGRIDVRIIAEGDPAIGLLRLRIAITEDDINRPSPNGTQVHNQTFRDMIPSAGGQSVTIAQGDTVSYSFDFSVDEVIAEENCNILAFVQSNWNRSILQGARIAVLELEQVSVDEDGALPGNFNLAQNYPNPFNAGTNIEFELTAASSVQLAVFDITGARVATLVDGSLEAGRHQVNWDAGSLSSGVYYYRLKANGSEISKKMTLLK